MEHLLDLLQWTLMALALVILLWGLRKPAQVNCLPPSPRGLPIIGHLHLIGSPPHISLRKLSQIHGSLMFLRFGSVPMVVVSSPEMAREVLQTHDAAFASRPFKVAADYFFYNSRDIAFSQNNQYLRDIRKLCATQLFTVRRLSSFTGILTDEIRDLCSELLKAHRDKQLVNVRGCVSSFAFNFTTRMLMRKSYTGSKAENYSPEEAAEFLELMSTVPKTVGKFCIGDAFPSLSWLNLHILAWKKIHKRMDDFLNEVLLDHRVKKSPEDFIDLLISHLGWGAITDIKAVTLDLLTAGTDTTTATIEWALAALLHKPDLLARLAQNELSDVVGNRMVEEDDIPRLELVNAIIKETFRLYPPVPLLIPHASDRAVKLGGYDIQKGSTVIVNAYAIGRDDTAWKNASDFNPERFIGSNVNVHGLDFELLPFGSGRRRCPGLILGIKSVQLGLSNLLHGFDWRFPESVPVESHEMVGEGGAVHFLETPLEAYATPKLSLEIYKSFKLRTLTINSY